MRMHHLTRYSSIFFVSHGQWAAQIHSSEQEKEKKYDELSNGKTRQTAHFTWHAITQSGCRHIKFYDGSLRPSNNMWWWTSLLYILITALHFFDHKTPSTYCHHWKWGWLSPYEMAFFFYFRHGFQYPNEFLMNPFHIIFFSLHRQ